MFLSIAILWVRQSRPAKEDPRLSRGLQLLQSKIAVLEDLSDRTETQVRQLTQILEERARALQTKILNAEEMIIKIEHSMRKSLDVAEIFQDKIPHEEIIGRNQTQKYVTAAKLAHEGLSIDEIVAQVGLPRSEVEFISKVNREELTFDPALLPEWAKPREDSQAMTESRMDSMSAPASMRQNAATQAVEQVFQPKVTDLSSLHRIEEDFKQSVRQAEDFERREAEKFRQAEERLNALKKTATRMTQNLVTSAESIVRHSGEVIKTAAERAGEKMVERANERAADRSAASRNGPIVRKVEFPRI